MQTAFPGQTIRLPDGRALGFAEYGDPNGAPLFFFHGLWASRLTYHPDDQIARSLGVRLITVDRPGIGLSAQSNPDSTSTAPAPAAVRPFQPVFPATTARFARKDLMTGSSAVRPYVSVRKPLPERRHTRGGRIIQSIY